MKAIHTALIVGAIAALFLVWNFRLIFGKKQPTTRRQATTRMSSKKSSKDHDPMIASKAMGEAIAMEQDQTALILSEILSLNRAAHVLTRSGSVLDKLLKMDKVKACETLIKDYGLSSAMVLVKREHHDEEEEVEEGFKKIESIDKKKMKEEHKEKTVKVNTESVQADHKEDDHHHHHHSTNDPLRIELYCKNAGREPRIGRAVRMVESEADHDEKYIIELIK